MARMIETLKSNLVCVAAYKFHQPQNNGIREFDLSFGTRIARRLGGFGMAQRLACWRLRNLIKKQRIQRILVNYTTTALDLEASWRGLSVEVFIHCHGFDVQFEGRDVAFPHAAVHDETQKQRIVDLSARAVFIANSKYTRDSLVNAGVSQARVQLKYFGVECVSSYPKGNRSGGLRCLFLGRLVDFKGPDLVIKAFLEACERGMEGSLEIAGDGHLMNACELLAHDSSWSDRIHFLGPVDRDSAKQLFARSDIFLNFHRKGPISFREEAFGVALIEAMSYGLPVLTARSGAVGESVVHGETGYLVEPEDIKAYVDCLLRLSKNTEELARLGSLAQAHVRKEFSLDQEREALLEILGLKEEVNKVSQ